MPRWVVHGNYRGALENDRQRPHSNECSRSCFHPYISMASRGGLSHVSPVMQVMGFQRVSKIAKDSDISINLSDKSLVTWENGRIIVNSKNTHRARFDGEKDYFSRRRLVVASINEKPPVYWNHQQMFMHKVGEHSARLCLLIEEGRDSRPKNIVCRNVYSYRVSRSLGLGVFPMSNVMNILTATDKSTTVDPTTGQLTFSDPVHK